VRPASTLPSTAASGPCGSCTWRIPSTASLGYDGHHGWSILQGRYTLAVLFEYAATLGLIDIEYVPPTGARDDYQNNCGGDYLDRLSRYDGLAALRLNRLGAHSVGTTVDYTPGSVPASATPTGKVSGLANFDIVALDGLPSADVLLLDGFAEKNSDRVWTLTTAFLLHALDRGRALDELRRYLDQARLAPPAPDRHDPARRRCPPYRPAP